MVCQIMKNFTTRIIWDLDRKKQRSFPNPRINLSISFRDVNLHGGATSCIVSSLDNKFYFSLFVDENGKIAGLTQSNA